ncbi:LCP family protein [Bacillus sp. 1P06AnD]|uniref:LCP family protein n=1 Tax=Bacillus sp. 1P06AnD TaxID=3132208 RepID=UPI0039A045C4
MIMIKKFSLLLVLILFCSACSLKSPPSADPGKSGKEEAEAKDPVYILILGIDTRGEERSRSDAILVGQYDIRKRSVKLVSLMRDTYVRIPGYTKGYNKLNTAYYLGGKELLIKTIKDNFNIPIDHYAIVDFNGFTEVVDAIAPEGLKLQVSKEMAEDMKLDVQPGKNVLHGKDVLKYVRFRHDDDNDFGRVKRQQEVMLKLKEKMAGDVSSLQQIAVMPKLIEGAMKYVETDLGISDTLSLASSLIMHKVKSVETMTIPISGAFENKSYDHAGSVLQMDKQKNVEALHGFFNHTKAVNK